MCTTQKLIHGHLLSGEMDAGSEIGIHIDQALLQDATGTLVMLELEAMGLKRVTTGVAVQYVDHNLLQADFRNADDHLFLKSAAQKFGLWFSRPGNGVSHPVHMERFGKPGATLLGSDSHTCAAGSLGMLAIGTGGLDVATVLAGEPYFVKMPKVLGVELTGSLPDWVSAKDVILEMLRRYDVKGGRGFIVEYYGEGVAGLSAMDRHVIANMGAELGATTTVFPSDEETRRFLHSQYRERDWVPLAADAGARYDHYDHIHLSDLEPLIARPGSPGHVVPVREVAGLPVHQVVVGSSANPGIRDFWVVSQILAGKAVHPDVSLDVNPTSRQVIENLSADSSFRNLMHSGARYHQAGCMGCIGMGQAPASGKNSLRTVPRNFPGRSGTLDDHVYLCSPETGAASALTGVITDPRALKDLYQMPYPRYSYPDREIINTQMLLPPLENGEDITLVKGPNIRSLPQLPPLAEHFNAEVLLKMGDNISTDEILRAGVQVLSFRSNIEELSKFAYQLIDPTYYSRANALKERQAWHVVVAGENYAQGSSREHAALAPRYLGQVAVLAKSYARIGWQNLVNFGIVPLEFMHPDDYHLIDAGDSISVDDLKKNIKTGRPVAVQNHTRNQTVLLRHSLSPRQVNVLLAGGMINYIKQQMRPAQELAFQQDSD